MITSLEIENFKSIGSPGIRIELRPITLLFGPNSAGKSTILQALQYLRHLVLYDSGDVDRTDHASGGVDLGGFRRLVHQHDLDRAIRIRIEHTRKTWMDLWLWEHFVDPKHPTGTSILAESLLKELVESIAMEVEVRWSHLKAAPYIAAYRVFVNGTQTGEVTSDPDRNHIVLTSASYEAAMQEAIGRQKYSEEVKELLRGALQDIDQYLADPLNPLVGEGLTVLTNPERRVIPDPQSTEVHWLAPSANQLDYMGPEHQLEVFHVISALVIGPAYVTWRELINMRHIGPIRDVPTRQLQEVVANRDLSWHRGSAAWNTLFRAPGSFVQEVSDWLRRKDRLDTGYGVRVRQVIELDYGPLLSRALVEEEPDALEELKDRLRGAARRKKLVLVEGETGLELAPSEVGTGLAQVVPVVVAALEPVRGLVAVEQPELHIHPRVQVALADLFIHGTRSDEYDELAEFAVNAPPIFLIETHSEHLMLRLLRRIEESTDGVSPDHLRTISPEDLSVNYLFTDPARHELKLVRLRVDARGEFIDEWPHGFFGERGDELFR